MRSLSSLICSEVGDTQNQCVAPRSTITTFSGAFETTDRPTTNPVPCAPGATRGADQRPATRVSFFEDLFLRKAEGGAMIIGDGEFDRGRDGPVRGSWCQRKDERKPLTVGRKGFSELRHTAWDRIRNFSYLKRP